MPRLGQQAEFGCVLKGTFNGVAVVTYRGQTCGPSAPPPPPTRDMRYYECADAQYSIRSTWADREKGRIEVMAQVVVAHWDPTRVIEVVYPDRRLFQVRAGEWRMRVACAWRRGLYIIDRHAPTMHPRPPARHTQPPPQTPSLATPALR